jgi:hypothetical protein
MKEKASVSFLWGGGAAALMLIPFLGKPLHMDAPLIVWAARQIRHDPLHFYGVAVNWFGTVEGLDRILRMPPLFAAMIAPFVNAEQFLPLAPLVCAVMAAWGIGVLAELWGASPRWAVLAAVATPAFVVCGSLVMPDMALLAFWTWAVVFQVKGHDHPWWWAAAALCATGAVLTKYSGLSLLPLLALYSLWRQRCLTGIPRLPGGQRHECREQHSPALPDGKAQSNGLFMRTAGVWALLIPLGVTLLYHLYTRRLYGQGLLSESVGYAFSYAPHTLGWFIRKTLTALSFAGGAFAVNLFFLPFLWSTKNLARWAWGAGAVMVAAFSVGTFELFSFTTPTHIRWGALIQMAVWVTGGVHLLLLAWGEWRARRDAASLTVLAWVTGTLAFAAWFNWSVTVRSLLPSVPAVGILLAWRAERWGISVKRRAKIVMAAAVVAFAAGVADARLARAAWETARLGTGKAVRGVMAEGNEPRIWFEGHWGFQYYLEKNGAKALDYERFRLTSDDLLLIPLNNIRVVFPARETVDVVTALSVSGPWGLTVHHGELGAGFHSDYWGPLPLAFGRVPPEKTLVLRPRGVLDRVRRGQLSGGPDFPADGVPRGNPR